MEIGLNALAIILFLGFASADLIAFSTLDRQKEIVIASRYGRQTSTLEILYVNLALLAAAFFVYSKTYRFLPAVGAFVLLVFLNSRMLSGIAPTGIFVGATFLEWNKITAYRIVNDQISTVEVQIFANRKRYALRCGKEHRKQVEAYFFEHSISMKK